MEERNKNNDQKMRDIFRKLNEESQAANNQWNAPSDELWGKIAQEVQVEKPKRRGWLWSVFAVLFLIGSGLGLYLVLDSDKAVESIEKNKNALEFNSKETTQANSNPDLAGAQFNPTKFKKNQNSINEKIDKTSSISPQKSHKKTTSSTSRNRKEKESSVTKNSDFNSQGNALKNTLIENSIATDNTNTNEVSTTTPSPTLTLKSTNGKTGATSKINAPVNGTIQESSPLQGSVTETSPDLQLGTLDVLPSLPQLLSIVESKSLQIKVNPKSAENTPSSNELNWIFPTVTLGVYFNPSVSYNSIQGDQPSIIAGSQRGNNWKNFGLRVEAMMSKNIALEIGIQRSTYNLRADYNIVFPYLNNGEQTNSNGDFDTEFSHKLPSPTGEVQTLMALTRLADHNVPNGEDVNVTYILDQQLDFVSVPITLKYYINADKPFAVSVRAGLLKHFRLRSNSLITDFRSHHDAIEYRHSDAQADVQFINKSNTSFTAGIGLNYRNEKGFHFFVEPSFTKAVIPTFSGSFENRPYTYELNVGVSYRLIK